MLDYKEEYHQYRLVMESHNVVAIHTATNKLVIPWAKKETVDWLHGLRDGYLLLLRLMLNNNLDLIRNSCLLCWVYIFFPNLLRFECLPFHISLSFSLICLHFHSIEEFLELLSDGAGIAKDLHNAICYGVPFDFEIFSQLGAVPSRSARPATHVA